MKLKNYGKKICFRNINTQTANITKAMSCYILNHLPAKEARSCGSILPKTFFETIILVYERLTNIAYCT